MVRSKKALLQSAFFICIVALSPATSAAAETARVGQVLDGDSLRLTDGRELRLIGINAPEHGKDGQADEPLAREARTLLTWLVAGTEIQIEYDSERYDRYRRTLAHVFLGDGRSAQELLLREGAVFLIAHPPNLARLETYAKAEAEARRAARGVWAHPYFKPRHADEFGLHDTGFRFVHGRIQRLGRGRDVFYFDLNDRFALTIAKEDWHYFGGDPARLVGHNVIVRGWVSAHENRLRLRVSHPILMELLN